MKEKKVKKATKKETKKQTTVAPRKATVVTAISANGPVVVPISGISVDVSDSVRMFKDDPAMISRLAASIKREGVIEPLVLDQEMVVGKYPLISGSRRLKAAREAGLKEVPCVLRKVKEGERLAIALAENIQRRNLSAMELALNSKRVRGEFGWEGEKNTKKVAEFMGVSDATITQHEKLLALKPETQRLVHERVMGSQAGQDIADIVKEYGEEKAEKVVKRAKEIEKERKAAKIPRADKRSKSPKSSKPSKSSKPTKPSKGKGAEITQASVRKAARELGVAPKKARTMQDLIEILNLCLDAGSEELKKLARLLLAWQKGELDDEGLTENLVEMFPVGEKQGKE
jgi:ParB family chromosome partitioning protein